MHPEAYRFPGPAGETKPDRDAPVVGPPPEGSRRILGTRVDATDYEESVDAVVAMARSATGGVVCAANVHVLMESFDDPALRRGLNAADRVTPDGMPLVWVLRRRGIPKAARVYGPTLTEHVCRRAAELGIPVGFYGSTQSVLDDLVRRLNVRFPGLRIAYLQSPPFRPLTAEEDAEVVSAIEESGARILFVGLGCPKQERWLVDHRESLSCAMLAVGAAFDFLAGRKPQAPAWLQRAGLEWLFRLCCEPRRLWRRYLVLNPRFLFHIAREFSRSGAFAAPVAGRRGR